MMNFYCSLPAGDDVTLQLLSVKCGQSTQTSIHSYITGRQKLHTHTHTQYTSVLLWYVMKENQIRPSKAFQDDFVLCQYDFAEILSLSFFEALLQSEALVSDFNHLMPNENAVPLSARGSATMLAKQSVLAYSGLHCKNPFKGKTVYIDLVGGGEA